MRVAEHIVLESDAREVPDPRAVRRVHADLEVRSRLRRRILQLRVIDYYYLAVRSRSRSAELEYVLDLRFVAGLPQLSRHVAWRWINTALGLLALTIGLGAWIGSSATPWWRHEALGACAAVAGLWGLATLIAAYRTTETVRLLSVHGQARLLEFTGGIGTLRAVRRFTPKLAAHLRIAAAARRATRAEQLRDEMREHQRLRNLGVLGTADYEASKARILAQHS
ncbi:MAG TPA: hypothetical protein VLV25_05720 [Steroidobacteraceae bacterium]|nr:hypothetical protein [Steroidobacteraceae bacterium]